MTLYVNESDWKTEEIAFPGDKSNDDCFINSTRELFMIKEGSTAKYNIREVQYVTTIHLDIVKKSSWWQIMVHFVQFMIQCSNNLWSVIFALSLFLVLCCCCICCCGCCVYVCRKLFPNRIHHCDSRNHNRRSPQAQQEPSAYHSTSSPTTLARARFW